MYSEKALQIGASISKVMVNHTKFIEALDGIGRIMQIGNCIRQPVGASLIAPAGAGKSALIDAVQQNARGWSFLTPGKVLIGTLKESPTVSQIQDDLLPSFHYAIPPRSRRQTNAVLFDVLVDAIAQHDIRLIALDEYQHVFLARRVEVHAAIVDWTKRLMSRTLRPVLLSGTDTLRGIERADPQLSTRVSSVFSLPQFRDDEELRGVLASFAAAIRDVNLTSLAEKYASRMFKATDGVLRLLKLLIVHAAMIAVDRDETDVEIEHLRMGFNRMVGPDSSKANPFA